MKYLSNREEFLKRSINKIEEHKEYEEYNKIFEEAPFANDIPWGDSLVGRLINRVIRNAKKGANLVRIKSVIKKLQDLIKYIASLPQKLAALFKQCLSEATASIKDAIKNAETIVKSSSVSDANTIIVTAQANLANTANT